MINITDKTKCCECKACKQVCPVQCIDINIDNEGFGYPIVDLKKCINCSRCEKVCPVLNEPEYKKPLETYAVLHKDMSIRMSSSSGGAFSALASKILANGGVVYGAALNNDFKCEHIDISSIEDIDKLRRSKYIQSDIQDTFLRTKQHLLEGKQVLFSGTPCQVAGLKRFLGKNDYPNLYLIDLVCHGVPSPLVWEKYLEEDGLRKGNRKDFFVNFRAKDRGWRMYMFKIMHNKKTYLRQSFSENSYMRLFLSGEILRPICYSCPFKRRKVESDVTLGDLWGVDKVNSKIDDDKGVSAVVVNTDKGKLLLSKLKNIEKISVPYESVSRFNSAFNQSSHLPKQRKHFFKKISEMSLKTYVNQYLKVSKKSKIIYSLQVILNGLGLAGFVRTILRNIKK